MFRIPAALLLGFAIATSALAEARISRPAPGEPVTGIVTLEVDAPSDTARVDFYLDDLLIGSVREHPWLLTHDAGFTMEPRSIRAVVWGRGMTSREVVERDAAAFRVDAEIDVDLVEVPLTIHSRSVTVDDFVVRENGAPQEIVAVQPARPDSHFVFVVDRSLSMRNGRLEEAMAAVRELAGSLRETDTAEVIFFNHTVSPPVSPEAAHASASGGTALLDALASISTVRRSVVVVVSDAHDRHSEATADDVRTLMRTRGITLFAVAMQNGNATGLLRELSATTGGMTVRTSDPREGILRIQHYLDRRSVLVYRSSTQGRGWRSIDVRPVRRGIRISEVREGYVAR